MKKELLVFGICLVLLISSVIFSRYMPSHPVLASAKPKYTFLLDAGHGGEDGGALTAAGEKESDINLAIALKADQLMGFCGMHAILIRSEDISIHDPAAKTIREKKVSDIRNRVSLIEDTENAMLLSIHQNSYSDPRYSGAQVFYGGNEVSKQWGEAAQIILRTTLDPDNQRAAKPIPDSVYLMNHITCPAILVECGFLSNGEEAALLLTETYQKQLALALTGIAACGAQMGSLT